MDILRNQLNRITSLFAKTTMEPESALNEEPWTIHDANLALFSALTQPSSPNTVPSRLPLRNVRTSSLQLKGQAIRPALPPEVVLQILEHPTRWILTSYVSSTQNIRVPSARSPLRILSLPPLSAEDARTIRRTVFEFKGQDQGWSSYSADHGTYRNTWTWFEVVVRNTRVEEGQPLEEVRRFELQRNRHAGSEPETYRIELGADHALVKGLREGDVIELDACASFPGWACVVHDAKIEVWSVDDLAIGENMKWVEYCEQDETYHWKGHWMDRALAEKTDTKAIRTDEPS